jgi:N4-(beta-N-acetylglucosaminyl)-L-asparaginase
MKTITRRDLVRTATAVGIAAVVPKNLFGQAPAAVVRKARPLVIASPNGFFFKNGGTETCIEKAFAIIARGSDVLDALIEGVNIVELDPLEDAVGYGGLPNADGVVQLDSCCMDGPKKRAGGVAALEGVRTPSRVARAVMDTTDHHLLVGKGAQTFARNMGFTVEDDLNTERSRKLWLEWKRRTDSRHYLDPAKRELASRQVSQQMVREGLMSGRHLYGTINCNGISAKGEICGVTTTSGLAWKIPGRVGDSPILGAGLYVDNDVGAAGSTGRGEANLYGLCSFLIVEQVRRGVHPKDAGMEALQRIKANTIEKRLRRADGNPNFNMSFYILNAKGEHAGVALYREDEDERGAVGQMDGCLVRYCICTENGPQMLVCEPLLPGLPQG